jgi:hypothetical protein
MGRDRAAYMRAYRAAQKKAIVVKQVDGPVTFTIDPLPEAQAKIAALEEEVRHLKAELAKRTTNALAGVGIDAAFVPDYDVRFNTRPFTPVPKRRG